MKYALTDKFSEINPAIYPLLILLVLFISLDAILVSSGCYMLVSKTLLLPIFLVASYLNKELRLFVRDWSVFIAFLIGFDVSRGLIFRVISHFQLPVYSDYVIQCEQMLTFLFKHSTKNHLGLSFARLLQGWQEQIDGYSMLVKFCVIVYASHFFYFFIVGFAIWRLKPNDFWRFKQAYLLCMIIGLICYLLIPTTPPWLASKQGLIAPVAKVYALILNAEIPSLLPIFDLNPIAAMPSIHVAFPSLSALILRYHFGVRSWPAFIYAFLVCFACVIVGAHYIADILAGLSLSLLCFLLIYRKKAKPSKECGTVSLSTDMLNQIMLSFIVLLFTMMLNIMLLPDAIWL